VSAPPASRPPANKRRPDAPRAKVIAAPPDPLVDEDSPLPGLAATTARPPMPGGRSPAGGRLGRRFPRLARFARGAQLVLGAAVALSAAIVAAWGLIRYVRQSPRFAIRTVVVDGNHRRSAATVASEGGLAVGANIFALDPVQAGAMITQDPWIEKATVTRTLPSTVAVTVVEREAAALAAVGGELYLATRDGDLFKKIGADDPSDLPVVTGVLPAQVANDRRGVVLALKRALDVAEELDRTGVTRRYPLEELHLEKDGSLVVTIGREAIALSLGQPPYRDKIEEASRILNEVARRKANASVIFLDDDAHPERVVVRMR
jgi:cell division protein FtsQ